MKSLLWLLSVAVSVVLFMAFPYRSMSAMYSGTVVTNDGNAPIAGVLVAAGYGLDRTHTDSAGRFSLVVHENAVQPRTFNRLSQPITIKWNLEQRSIDLTNAPEISSVSLYRLNGARIWKGIRDGEKRILKTSATAPGVCLAVFSRSDGSRFTRRSVSGAGEGSCMITAPSFTEPLNKKASAFNDEVMLIFRHDGYFPFNRQMVAPASDLIISMKPDPRALFFDPAVVHTISFTLTHNDSLAMERNALAEEFIPAEFTFNGTAFGKVGLRYKGSDYYSMPRCFDEEGNRATYADCRNVSLKVRFDEYSDTARLYGMKRLNLHSMSYDDSKVREMLAYELFRESGIYTCRTVFVKVLVNGVSRGIFAGVEEIDGRFTKSRWPSSGDGNLYKEVWPIYAEESKYRAALKTNDKPEDSADIGRMVDFYAAINSSTEQTFVTTISPFIDLDYWLRFIVVDRAIHNGDGVFTWYIQDNWFSNHNYYIYEDEAPGGKFWFIPWDMNATFTKTDPIFDDYDVPEWNETPGNCEPVEVWGGMPAVPPNCDPLTKLTAATRWNRYVALGDQFLAEIFTPARMQANIERLAKVIEPAMKDDPFVGYDIWRSNCEWLSTTMTSLHKGFNNYLHDGGTVRDTTGFSTPFPGDSGFLFDRVNNFEFSPAVKIDSWAYAYISEKSSISLLHDTTFAVWGKGDLRCTFVFRPADTATAYSEWAVIALNFNQTIDCSGLVQLRIDLQSDVSREVRIGLSSDVFKRNGVPDGEGYCWSVTPGKMAKQFTLDIDDIDYPQWVKHKRPELLDSVLAGLNGIVLNPSPLYENDGELRTVPDSGSLRIDNVRFVVEPH